MLHRLTVALLLVATIASAQEKDAYFGFDLDRLAEAVARLTTFYTQHGEKGGNAAFDGWLREKGSSRKDYESAYAAWWERFGADHTGQLEARFHRINAEYVQRLNFADAPDRRGEAKEGVTLDQYAQIAVDLTRKGGTLDAVLKKHGLKDEAHWKRVNEAWTAAMRADTSMVLIQQYGALYQKYAGEDFAKEQEAKVAASLAEHRRRPEAPTPTPPPPPRIEEIATRLEAKLPSERWEAARQYAWQCDLKAHPGYCDAATLKTKLLPVMLDALEHFDDKTIHWATGMLSYFGELKLKSPQVRSAVARALNRTEERLAVLQSAWEPIADKAVPERIVLRTKLDEHTAAAEEFRAALARW